jgi:hypothetical protein
MMIEATIVTVTGIILQAGTGGDAAAITLFRN